MLVVSPHFDDAVFSCADRIAAHPGTTVVTVLAGVPEAAEALSTEWDRGCGFAHAAEAVRARREEDRAALAALGALPLWLDDVDGQYAAHGARIDVMALAAALSAFEPQEVFVPLGLFHPDHLSVHAGALQALASLAWPASFVMLYGDAIYRSMPGVVQARIDDLARAGHRLVPVPRCRVEPGLKRRAAYLYASQWPRFGEEALADLDRPETCWRFA